MPNLELYHLITLQHAREYLLERYNDSASTEARQIIANAERQLQQVLDASKSRI